MQLRLKRSIRMNLINCFICLAVFVTQPLIAQDTEFLQQQVKTTEVDFAKTMADRDFEAFQQFISEEAVFISDTTARRGREDITEYWKPYFNRPKAPFSWRPQTVVVLASGKLALSSGPVYNASGKLIAYYSSTWRLEEPGIWRVVFDKGFKACD